MSQQSKRPRSWGYYVLSVAPEAVSHGAAYTYPWRHRCLLVQTCQEPTAYLIGCRYFISRRLKHETTACKAHAAEYAAQHGLPWPPVGQPVDLDRRRWVAESLDRQDLISIADVRRLGAARHCIESWLRYLGIRHARAERGIPAGVLLRRWGHERVIRYICRHTRRRRKRPANEQRS